MTAILPRLRIGVLGTAGIIRMAVPQMQQSAMVTIATIASRSADKADRVANELAIPKAHGSYDALLADPDIDAVYLALPIALHAEWTIRALDAGKHVLCEKPLAATAAEAAAVAEAAARTGRVVWEGFMLRHHPQWRAVTEALANDLLGEVKSVQGMLTRIPPVPLDAAATATRRDLAGGVLLDAGCYMVHLARLAMGTEPRRVAAIAEHSLGLDVHLSAFMQFDAGTASFTCSTLLRRFQRMLIVGTKGSLDIRVPVMPPPQRPTIVVADFADIPLNQDPQILEFGPALFFREQIDAFADAIASRSETPFGLDNSISNMHVLDALRQSADRNGAWTQVSMQHRMSAGFEPGQAERDTQEA